MKYPIIAKHILQIRMDYNLTVMSDFEAPRTRRRMRILAVIIATIPCYCAGFIALSFAPDADVTQTITATATSTYTTPTLITSLTPVSYTHLDVYKRQEMTHLEW